MDATNNVKTYHVIRQQKRYLRKAVTVPAHTDIDDVIETAWATTDPWQDAGSRDVNIEVEEA